MKMDYIACQLNIAKLDEVQRIILSYELKQNVGLCGPAGVGKTELVEGLVTLLDKRMHAITCDERMTESGIIAYPVLESNGGTKTGYRNNVLAEALLNGEGFYGDEFELLDGSLQKRMNSAFDHRKRITRRDGVVIISRDARDFDRYVKTCLRKGCVLSDDKTKIVMKIGDFDEKIVALLGKPGFFGIIAYNPKAFHRQELEDSVADRFVNIFYDYLPEKVEAAIALRLSGIDTEIKGKGLEQRAIYNNGNDFEFLKREHDCASWKILNGNLFNEDVDDNHENLTIYETVIGNNLELKVEYDYEDILKFALELARFNQVVRNFADNGTKGLDEDTIRNLKDQENITIGETKKIKLHKPSPRTLQYAISEAKRLTDKGLPYELVKQHAAMLAIDQICTGSLKTSLVDELQLYELITTLARVEGLLPRVDQRSDLG